MENMILLFKGGGFSGGIGGLFFILSLVVGFYLLVLVLGFAYSIFCKILGVSEREDRPIIAFYERVTKDTISDMEHHSLLSFCVMWLIALSAIVFGVWLMIRGIEDDNSLLFLLSIAYIPVAGVSVLLFRHFYLRYLNRIGRMAKWNLLMVLGIVAVVWIMALQSIWSTPGYKIRQFNRVIVSSERSKVVETDFFAGFRLGINRDKYEFLLDSLMSEGLLDKDSKRYGIYLDPHYLGYDNPENNHCVLTIRSTFLDGYKNLYHIGFSLYQGDPEAFKADVSKRFCNNGWKHLAVPQPNYGKKTVYPRYNVDGVFDDKNLYNKGDEVYVKDNMLVVVRPYAVDFYDMPTFAKRPYWNK